MSQLRQRVKVVVDQNISLPADLSDHLQLTVLPGRDIRPCDVRDADALLVRSVTRVNRTLLQNSSVRFVGTATSGTDHLDLEWLATAGIAVADAAGANANAVTDYVLSCLASLLRDELMMWSGLRVAVVGVGRVGSQLVGRLQGLGVNCVGCDPFQQVVEGLSYVPLSDALTADVVCLHTPLTITGPHPTWHMLDADHLANLAPQTILINAGRGEVIDNQALRVHAQRFPERKFILDVWENEPFPDAELLRLAYIATPHIAGYSLESKEQAGHRILNALYQHFELSEGTGQPATDARGESAAFDRQTPAKWAMSRVAQSAVAKNILRGFSAWELSERFSRDYLAATTSGQAGETFDRYRREQLSRREFSALPLPGSQFDDEIGRALTAAGFTVRR